MDRERERELARELLGVAGASGSDTGKNALAGENRDCKERRFFGIAVLADVLSDRGATERGNASATVGRRGGIFLEVCARKRWGWGRKGLVRAVCGHDT